MSDFGDDETVAGPSGFSLARWAWRFAVVTFTDGQFTALLAGVSAAIVLWWYLGVVMGRWLGKSEQRALDSRRLLALSKEATKQGATIASMALLSVDLWAAEPTKAERVLAEIER